jgi:hypothetical protein
MTTPSVDDAPSASSLGGAGEMLAPLMDWLEHSPRYRLVRILYHRHENVVPGALFLGGVGWDAATLRRVDALLDNVILGAYLLLLGGFIVLTTLARSDTRLPTSLQRLNQWSTGAIQFLAGGLFSAYVIYYTQSASLSTASLFLLVLVAVLVANEFIWDRTLSVYVLVGVYFLAVFCYFTFFLPVVFGTMGFGVFLTAGCLSAALLGLLVLYFDRKNVFPNTRSFLGAFGIVVLLLGMMNLFYLQHWIPPVPLALRHGGAYDNVEVRDDAYALRYEKAPWWKVWEDADQEVVHYEPGDPVYAFAAVFAPTDLQTKVYHRWQVYDPASDTWQSTDRIGYEVVGGRQNGYRGYTYKRHVRPGQWRVTVETADRRPIGRISFQIVEADSTAPVHYDTRLYR